MEIQRWNQGRPVVDDLIATRRLERVSPSRDNADKLLHHAKRHLASAQLLEEDPVGAFQLTYDAARKAITAILLNQGLRVRAGEGGHAMVLEVVVAQLDPPLGQALRQFDWMRRLRNASEYPDFERPVADEQDVDAAVAATDVIIDIAANTLDQTPVY